jgi:hypothetical protein
MSNVRSLSVELQVTCAVSLSDILAYFPLMFLSMCAKWMAIMVDDCVKGV